MNKPANSPCAVVLSALALALSSHAPQAATQEAGLWIHSVEQHFYDDKDRIGASWLQPGETFFTMITCSPRSPALNIELGFVEEFVFDVETELAFLAIDGVNYFLPFEQKNDDGNFLQIYLPWEHDMAPWGGQSAFIDALLAGGEMVVMAAPKANLSQSREMLRVIGQRDGPGFATLKATCGRA